MQDYLEKQSNAIEAVMSGHGFRVIVLGGELSPRLVHYRLGLPPTVRLPQLAPLLGDLASALGVDAVRLSAGNEIGTPSLEVPRPDPVQVRMLPLAKHVAKAVPERTATLGIDTAGAPLLLRLDAREVGSVLLSGESGAGKSSLLQMIALSLTLHNSPDALRLLAIDLSEGSRRTRNRLSPWRGMEDMPHFVCEPIRDGQDAHLRLRWLGRLLNERRDTMDEKGAIDGPALVILIDGLDVLMEGSGGAERRKILSEIGAQGRELKLFLVAATRRPVASDGTFWGARLVGRSANADTARTAAGIHGSGAEGLLGEGDFLAVLGGDAIRFQAAWASPEEIARSADLLLQVADAERRARDLQHPSPEAQLKDSRPPSRNGRNKPRPDWAPTGSGGPTSGR